MSNQICIIEGCTRFRDKKQNRRVCQMHRVRYGRHKSYELPTSPKLPDGILKICKHHGELTSVGVYTHKGRKDLLCRTCVKESIKKCKAKKGDYQLSYYIKNSGIKFSKEEYAQLLNKQNNLCAICKKPESIILVSTHTKPKRLAIDHCHTTKKIRGLLCQKCNTAIGAFGESIEVLQSAIEYLKKYS